MKENLDRKLLIVIDVQNDFVTGSLGSSEALEASKNVVNLVNEHHKDVRNLTIFTKDYHDSEYLNTSEGKNLPVVHCLMNTKGSELIDELSKIEHDIWATFYKNTFAFKSWNTYLNNLFDNYQDISEIKIVGLVTDICVIANAIMIKTYAPDHVKIVVDAKCCAGTSKEMHEKALDVMKSLQIDVINR